MDESSQDVGDDGTAARTRTPASQISRATLHAVRNIIEHGGYDSFTIRTLAQCANVSPTSIYRHIGDKQAVVKALIAEEFHDLRKQLTAVDDVDPVLRLRNAGLLYRRHALASPGVYRLLWSAPIDAAATECLSAIADIVRYGQRAGVLRDGSPDRFATALWSGVHGHVEIEIAGALPGGSDDAARLADYEFLLDLLIQGMVR